MDRSEEDYFRQPSPLDQHVKELHESSFTPMPPATTVQLGHHALEDTPAESLIEARVQQDGSLDAPHLP